LHRRRFGHNARILLRQIDVVDVFPPTVGVLYQQLHHEIGRVFLNVKVLEKKPEIADLKLSDLIIGPVLLKPRSE
jgi:hypothetical protein